MWQRRINGHLMEIQVYREMGGAIEEIIVWCHTCDPTGARVWLQKYSGNLKDDFTTANTWAELHAGLLTQPPE